MCTMSKNKKNKNQGLFSRNARENFIYFSLNFNETSKCFSFFFPPVWKSHYIVGKHAFMVVLLLNHHEKCIKDGSTKLLFIFSKVKI